MRVEGRVGRGQRYQQVAGRDEIGLHERVNDCRTLGAVAGDEIIGALGRAHCLHCADGEHIGVVTWRGDGAVTVRGLIASVVAGSHHHHDAVFPSALDGLAEWVKFVRFIYGAAERKVDHPDVVG